MDFGRYDREDLQEALRVLREGGIIVYPTDTVWGIGCDATNEAAVAKIYALKQREDSKSMLVLLDSAAKLDYYVDVPETAEMLLGVQSTDRYTDRVQTELQDEDSKPLTLIYPNARHLAKNLIAEDGSIGIRITNEAFSKALCAQLKHPVVSTSANISGHPTAHFFHEIEEAILNGADYVCRFRREDETPHEPSSIIKVNADSTFVIIRE
ncbi:MAG: threonylcarbamoyl-AMP synthase [Paludibacteraceae bacterium]|nr:threonylcarbamoyl-AMP synthase [Paludibacteraceae bacterium]